MLMVSARAAMSEDSPDAVRTPLRHSLGSIVDVTVRPLFIASQSSVEERREEQVAEWLDAIISPTSRYQRHPPLLAPRLQHFPHDVRPNGPYVPTLLLLVHVCVLETVFIELTAGACSDSRLS